MEKANKEESGNPRNSKENNLSVETHFPTAFINCSSKEILYYTFPRNNSLKRRTLTFAVLHHLLLMSLSRDLNTLRFR